MVRSDIKEQLVHSANLFQFLLADAILIGLDNVTNGLVVYPKRIEWRNKQELPFVRLSEDNPTPLHVRVLTRDGADDYRSHPDEDGF